MKLRKEAYYRLNEILKKSYHARIRAGEDEGIYEIYREMNERIVAIFAHSGAIDAETAAALGHTHEHREDEEADAEED